MKVHIKSPARLHLGVIDLSGALGRRYGSIGVAIDEPCVELWAMKSDDLAVTCRKGIEISPAEVEGFANRVLSHFKISGGAEIKVEKEIPRHVGLGSTTQMALSVATAVTKLYGVNTSAKDLSELLGLGEVSGIGTATFEAGGFIVDGGVKAERGLPPRLFRLDFPKNWFFVVAVPKGKKGLSGEEEKRVFEEISVPPDYAKDICYTLVMKMLPAVIEEDIKSFGEALTAIQVLVGKSFSRYQEGIYSSKMSEDLVRFLLENGAHGSGQSSWGPTVYGVVEGVKDGEKLRDGVREFIRKKGFEGDVYCTAANNRGASIEFEVPA